MIFYIAAISLFQTHLFIELVIVFKNYHYMKTLFFASLLLLSSSVIAQIDLQTGAASYNIPLFDHTDSKTGLGTGISLIYNSGGGVKIGQYASGMGEGWDLNMGGSVMRMQNGEPDDQYLTTPFPAIDQAAQIYHRLNPNEYDNYYANGYLYTNFGPDVTPTENALMARFNDAGDIVYHSSPRAQSDREQDIFIIIAGGSIIEFVIGKNGVPKVLDESRGKIVFNLFTDAEMQAANIRTRIKSFVYTNESGIVYQYTDYELTEITHQESVSTNLETRFSMTNVTNTQTGKYTINKWQLTSIQNPFTNAVISFTYTDQFVTLKSSKVPSYQRLVADNPGGGISESSSLLELTSFTKLKLLKDIIYPDGFKITVNYSQREDAPVPLPNFINVFENSRIARQILFTHKYFYHGTYKSNAPYYSNENDRRFLRLCLSEIKINDQVYKFDYYTGTPGSNTDIVGPTFSLAQDAWGYYNASSLIDDSNPVTDGYTIKDILVNQFNQLKAIQPGLAKNGLLKMVTLPTNGTINFEYEQNNCLKNNGTPTSSGGVRVSKITSKDFDASVPVVSQIYKYEKLTGESSGWGFEDINNYFLKRFHYRKYLNVLGSEVYTVNGLLKTGMPVKLALQFTLSTLKLVGISFPELEAAIFAINWFIYAVDNIADYDMRIFQFYPQNFSNPIPLRYSRVVSYNENLVAQTGKIAYEFTMPANLQTDILPNNFPYSSKQRMESWKYGMPKKVVVYNGSNVIIKETENNYDFITNILNNNYKSYKFEPAEYFSSRFDFQVYNASSIPNSYFGSESYYMKTGRARLLQTSEINYMQSGKSISSTITNQYINSIDHLPRETFAFNSKGEKVGHTTYYSSDYNINTGAMGELANKNILNLPITTLNWFIPQGGNTKLYTGIAITEYTITPDGSVKPYIMHTAYNKDPIPESLVGAFNPASIFITYPNLRPVMVNDFNNKGDVSAISGDGNQKVSFVYDFNGKFKVASVVNADPLDIAYSSFETNNAKTGNWAITDPYFEQNPSAPTGKQYLNMRENSSSISSGQLNPGITYIVSYWSNKGTLNVHGSMTSPTVTINGWGLYIHEISGASGISINTVSLTNAYGFVGVDELRLYPKDTRMSTVVYDPIVGKISDCDANNRISYYTYDDNGRLIMIQDQLRNAIKTFEYNNINH
jgi:hypothetical protein